MIYQTLIFSQEVDGYTEVAVGFNENTLDVTEVRITSTKSRGNLEVYNPTSSWRELVGTGVDSTVAIPEGMAKVFVDEAGEHQLDPSTLRVRFY